MPRLLFAFTFVVAAGGATAQSTAGPKTAPSGHYMFAWTGDVEHAGMDFLAVIDADPASPSYGKLMTTLATDQKTRSVHHTEYVMPASAMLFANDHRAGRTFIFDLRDGLHPVVKTSFTDLAGYMHPHSYLRLPNGHVLATYQREHHDGADMSASRTGGLVEIDDEGKVVRSASNADPAFPNSMLLPYSLAVLPALDRVVLTNSSMEYMDQYHGQTVQIWRLSDLKLLKTILLDGGDAHYAQSDPEEVRVGPDGSVWVQTLACGLERISEVNTDNPVSNLAYTFPGAFCGVPTIVGHFLVQSVPMIHGLIVLDIGNPSRPVEVSRLELNSYSSPHWTAWDPKTGRLVVTGSETRLYMVKFDPATGALSIDTAFKDAKGRPGFDFDERKWPHGWTGAGLPHGVVFSR